MLFSVPGNQVALHRKLADEQSEQDHQNSSPDSRRDSDVIKAG